MVLVGRVVHHQVDQDPNPALLRRVRELHEIAESAVARIDIVIIGDVVSVVFAGRSLERHQPDRGHSEAVQVIQPSHQSLEIADAVAVRIHVGADREAIDDGVLVPKVVDHARGPKILSCRTAAPRWSRCSPFVLLNC